MRALLRLQAALFLRSLLRPISLVSLVALVVFLVLLMRWNDIEGERHPTMPLLIAALVFVSQASVRSLEGLDAVRWPSPVSARRVLAAHLLSWAVFCAIPAAAYCLWKGREGPWGLFLFADLVLFGVTVAAAAPLILREQRRLGPVLGGLVGMCALGAVWGVLFATWGESVAGWLGHGWQEVAVLLIPLSISVVLGARAYEKEEMVPRMESGVSPRDPGSAVPPTDQSARTTAASVLRSTWPPLETGMWVAMSVGLPLIPSSPDYFGLLWVLGGSFSLGTIALRGWRWLVATPIDRGRAFRILFLPVLLFAAFAAALRFEVRDLWMDRTVFFNDFRRAGPERSAPGTLVLGNILRVDPEKQVHLPPEPSYMAERVRAHLQARYGLQVPEDRVLATILRGWAPGDGEWSQEAQAAAFDAMERVHSDLEGNIRSADRMRGLVKGLIAILGSLLVLRLLCAGHPWGRVWVLTLVVLFAGLLMLADYRPGSAPSSWILAAREMTYGVFQAHGILGLTMGLLGAAGIGVLLWRSAGRAFCQLDITRLPEPPASRGV